MPIDRRFLLALGTLGTAAAAVVAVDQFGPSDWLRRPEQTTRQPVTLRIYFGGEKSELLRDPQVLEILRGRYAITLDAAKAGSVEMVLDPALLGDRRDCRWPSNQVAYDMYVASTGVQPRQQNIFNSPLVIFTWAPTAKALTDAGIVQKKDGVSYLVDMPRLIGMMEGRTEWKALGLPYYGRLRVDTTDPTRSNSGNMFSALLATILNQGEPPTAETIVPILPRLVRYFQTLGRMDETSSDSFSTFLVQGEGGRPLTVGYENQIAEYALLHPEQVDLLRSRIVTLYPVPTIWSSHPLIAETRACDRLIEAMIDPDIQRLAWERHGFRSGALGVSNDPKILKVAGVPETIGSVVPMPSAAAMKAIIAALQKGG
jgi:hypothetical protein